MDEPTPLLPKRSRALTVLTLALAVFQAGAALNAVQVPAEVAGTVSLPPLLALVLAILWAGAFAWMTVRLWQRKPQVGRRAVWLVAGFIFYSIGRLALFARADYDRQRLPFLLMATFFIFIILLAGMFLARFIPKTPTEIVKHGGEPEN